jgi:hypothetical protein
VNDNPRTRWLEAAERGSSLVRGCRRRSALREIKPRAPARRNVRSPFQYHFADAPGARGDHGEHSAGLDARRHALLDEIDAGTITAASRPRARSPARWSARSRPSWPTRRGRLSCRSTPSC